MSVIFANFLFVALACLAHSREKILFLLSCIAVWSAAAFRIGEGPDYYAYLHAFELLLDNPILEFQEDNASHEVLFRTFGSFLKFLNLNFFSYQLIISFLILWPTFTIVKNYSYYPILSLLLFYALFFFSWPYSGLRQAISLSWGMFFLVVFISRARTLNALLAPLFLSAFHLSALCLYIFFIFAAVRLKASFYMAFISLSVIAACAGYYSLSELVLRLPFPERIAFYASDFFANNFFDIKTYFRLGIFSVCLFSYFVFLRVGDEFNRKISVLVLLSFPIYLALKFSEILAAQISLYGLYLVILSIPNFIYYVRGSYCKFFILFSVSFCSFFVFKKNYDYMKYASASNAESYISRFGVGSGY